MKNKSFVGALVMVMALVLGSGCSRIETGEVGVRINMSKEIQGGELMPGTWNQTLVGDVLTFPVRDLTVSIENKAPLTADNSALADFDITVIYAINPSSVAELYSTKSKSFHFYDKGDWYLMYNYIGTLVNNASYKVVRQYKALEVADNRAKIEQQVMETVSEQLKADKLDTSITLTTVQVRNVAPNPDILKAATEYVRVQNELRIKETEVAIAKKEAERMAALANNSVQSIAYMSAQAELNYSEAAKAGKIQTIVVPRDFKGIVNIK